MIFLLLAILSSAMIAVIMRISSDKVSANLSMLAANYLVCSLLGAGYAGFRLSAPEVDGFPVTVGLGAVSGVLYLLGFILLQVNTRKNGVVLSSLFMKLGLLVPILLSVVLFREAPTSLQTIGFCLAVGAIVLINWNREEKGRHFGLGLIALLLAGGSGDAMAKVYERMGPPELSDLFLFYTFGTAFLLCLALVFWKKERPGPKDLLFGCLIGIPNFFCSKFLLASLSSLPAVVVYPTFSVATILVVTLAGVVFFREQLVRRQWVALGAILAALVLLNL